MTDIPQDHPRYRSLITRERIVQGMRDGIVAEAGLIAHGRGEALDYLMGERTLPEAQDAEEVAAQVMLLAERSVISVNGNTVILAAEEIVELARLTNSRIEVNLFHRTPERITKITDVLVKAGAEREGEKCVLGAIADARIPGLDSERGKCSAEGIGSADVILVPLEDGDRAEALKRMGKIVICIDLNPLSRTSRTSDIAIADEVGRALGNMNDFLEEGKVDRFILKGRQWRKLVNDFDNQKNLDGLLDRIANRLVGLRAELDEH
jgi:4-phosphopantoate---beta-alanine ligase